MAGKPVRRRMRAILDERADDVFERLANGDFVTAIVEDIEGVSRYGFYDWINLEPERRELYDRVRKYASHGMVEDAIRLVDEAREDRGITAAQASLVREQASIRKWVAGMVNKEDYGEGKQADVDVTVNLQSLHLEALKSSAGKMNMLPDDGGRNTTASDRFLEAELVEEDE